LVAKDKKNFGVGDTSGAVIAITLNAVLLSASVPKEDEGGKGGKKAGGKGGGGGSKAKAKAGAAKPKIGAKVERLPPPTSEAASKAIIEHKATLEKVCKVKGAKGVEDVKGGQQSLLLALEAFICNEYNEPLLPATPQLFTTFSDQGLLEKDLLAEYWTKVKSTRESDTVDLEAAKKGQEEAVVELTAAEEELKKGKKEDADSAQQLKWAATEVLNARTGNQPTTDEVQREKAAQVGEKKARDERLQKTKNLELAHKRQVNALNGKEAAIKLVAEKVSQGRACELIHKYGQPFFDPSAVSNGGYPGKEAQAEAPAEAKSAD